ncbi:glycosyltransferase family 2 protein [Jatrophihabitans sp. YIM 134969]
MDVVVNATTAVVVLNWNGGDDTIACLCSLASGDLGVVRYVVDNGSTDDSADRVERSGLADVVIRTGANLGYAGGNNAGLERVLADGFTHVAVLNNDTVVAPRAISELVATLVARPDATSAAVSPRIDVEDDGRLWFAGGVVDRGWPRHLQPPEVAGRSGVVETDLLTGCALVAHRDVWARTGGFDEGFFLIFEDSDWSVRARSRGVTLLVDHDVTVAHKVSRSFRAPRERRLASYYFVRNGLVFEARWARRHLLRFVLTWIVRPTARAVRDRQLDRDLALRWWALAAALTRRRGPASTRLARFAGAPSGVDTDARVDDGGGSCHPPARGEVVVR